MVKFQYFSKFNNEWRDYGGKGYNFVDVEEARSYISYLVKVQQWVNDTFRIVAV